MKKLIGANILIALLVVLTTGPAISGEGWQINELTKKEGAQEAFGRIIRITPNTRWVNVAEGELVKFIDTASGKSFIWNVDNTSSFSIDLARVAPAGFLTGRRITAYIQPKCDCGG